jgi:hypothetical protein
VLFCTVLLLISDSRGNFHHCRAVLDQFSEVSLITESMCKKLNLQTYSSNASITGVNVSENIAHKGCNVVVKSRVGNFTTGVDCFVLPKITQATPAVSFDKSTIELPSDIILANPNFNVSQEINLLIGAGLYWELLIGGPTQLHRNQPYFQETQLGWLVSGDLKLKNSVSKFSCNFVSSERNLERQVAQLWESENIVSENDESLALETSSCENHFVKNTCRTPSGKFMVKLPFKETINLGESWTFAYKRFLSLEKRFERDHKMANSYKEFMTEYLSLRHMELVPLKDRNSPNSFYLPHLAVYKHTAEGPKIRVVYDCSAKSSNEFLNTCTKFNFIPARSPHFGGLWERCVQSVKHHLRRILGDASVTYEEFYTLLTRIEACLNSRPLIPLSQDPNDLEALTPGHFLIGAPLTAPYESDVTDRNTNGLTRWQRITQLQQYFWKWWQKEYLSQLQTRPRGQQHQHPNVDVGALVVLIEDNLPPLQWRLGRVVHVHPGSDGVVRVVSVKTVSGTYKRAVKKLCIIPTEAV